METLLYADENVEARELTGRRVLVVTRLPSGAGPDEVLESIRRLTERITPGHHGYGLVIDLRAVVGRSDPDFERATRGMRNLVARTFARSVSLVRTQAGKLQTVRLAREEGHEPLVSFDYDEAIAMAAGEIVP